MYNLKIITRNFSIIFLLVLLGGCNVYKKRALLACGQPDPISSYDLYKLNRDKSVKLFSSSEDSFAQCDAKYAGAFKDAEKRAFTATLERANRSLTICKDDMVHEVNYNAPWIMGVASDEMIINYTKYKQRYIDTRNFDIDALGKCVDYYKNFDENQERKQKIAQHQAQSLMEKYNYRYMWDEKGLSGLVQAVSAGDLNVSKAKQYLVKKDNLLFDSDLAVDEVFGDLVIYRNLYDKELAIALQRQRNEAYTKGSNLTGSYFVVAGVKKYRVSDKITDIIVFKKIY